MLFLKRAVQLLILLAFILSTLLFSTITENIALIKFVSASYLIYFAALLFFVYIYKYRTAKLKYSPHNLPIVLFLLWGIVTYFFTPYKYTALEEINRFWVYGLTALMIIQVFDSYKELRTLIFTFVALLILSVIYVTLQDHGIDFVNWGMRVHTAFACCPHYYAAFVIMTIGFCYSGLIYSLSIKKYALSVVLFLFILYSIYTLTAGYHIFGGIIGVIYYLIFISKIRLKRSIRIFSALSLLLFLSVFGVVFNYTNKTFHRDTCPFKKIIFSGNDSYIKVRTEWLKDSIDMALDSPIVGKGIGTFQIALPFYRTPRYHHLGMSHNTLHVHNEYLEILAEEGMTGLALYILLLISIFYTGQKSLRNSCDIKLKLLQIAALTGLLSMLIASIYSSSQRWVMGAYPFWILIGIIGAIIRISEKSEVPGGAPEGFIETSAQSEEYIGAAESKIEQGLGEMSVQQKPTNKIKKPPIFYPLLSIFILGYLLFAGIFFNVYKSNINLKRLEIYIVRRQWAQAITTGKLAHKQNPYNRPTLYKLGYVYLNKGKYRNAYGIYAKILQLAPRYAQSHYNLGLLFQEEGDIYRALDEFRLAFALENNVVNAMRVANVYLQLNEKQKSIFYFRRAISIPPYNIRRDGKYQKIGYKQLAQVYLVLDKKDEAIRLLKLMEYKGIESQWTLKKLIELLPKHNLSTSSIFDKNSS